LQYNQVLKATLKLFIGFRGSIGDELKNVGTKGPPLLEISEIETGKN